ncbi:two-component system, response regulator YesN [Lachnospiraceae bacterium NK3A20]|nr:two-component system, response regulator YesN [Lachnospiraceae bacterium NK3A20]
MIRVLVVEDEKFVRQGIIRNTNWKSVGCEVAGSAADGNEGLEEARALRPDLIISDIRMPGMSGLQMVRQLREEGMNCKVIFLTAFGEFHYAQEALRLQAADYILKPYRDGELENVIRRLLGNSIIREEEQEEDDILPLKAASSDMNRYVQTAIAYIEAHFGEENINITEIAQSMGVSEGHLSRLFKKDTDMSISTYITRYRMRKAMRLLSDVRYKVYEVGEMVGYHDIGYFSSLFKRIVGVTPSEYRGRSQT